MVSCQTLGQFVNDVDLFLLPVVKSYKEIVD